MLMCKLAKVLGGPLPQSQDDLLKCKSALWVDMDDVGQNIELLQRCLDAVVAHNGHWVPPAVSACTGAVEMAFKGKVDVRALVLHTSAESQLYFSACWRPVS